MFPQAQLLPELIEFLKSKPADEEYNYTSAGHCLIGQFLFSRGEKDYKLLSREVMNRGWDYIAYGGPDFNEHWKFGKALARAIEVQNGRSTITYDYQEKEWCEAQKQATAN